MECPKCCLNCANSFSEQGDEKDILHCMVHDEEIVDESHCCEEYN